MELLQQIRLLDPVNQLDRVGDVLIAGHRVEHIADHIDPSDSSVQVRDGRGLVLGTGLVDLYSHSGEPGFEERETLSSLGAAAIAGGFTRLTLLPDTVPPLEHPGEIELLQARLADQPLRVQVWGAFTQKLQGEQLTQLAELAPWVAGFSDGVPIANLTLLRRGLEYLKPLQKPIALWACDRQLVGQGVMREGLVSLRLGLPGDPAFAETTALAALLELVEAIQTPVHLMRISTARGVELIQTAKARGLPITASTPWMHLLLNTDAIASYNPHLRLAPPLGNPVDQQALIEAVKTGVIDAIAIDHAPYTYEEKTLAFAEAPPGAIGLELALTLLWQRFVATGEWTALQLWQALSTRPAHCLGQAPPTLAGGELLLFDPERQWSVNPDSLQSRSCNTPWLDQTLQGKVVQTWCASG
uniref:Dihydroorotase, multifunctional complex type n=1 Tax=Cyanothece sp. (strain PCC 7425 / ATCC 29141) TaxID=395961 RepID=B8HPL8_CYAP4